MAAIFPIDFMYLTFCFHLSIYCRILLRKTTCNLRPFFPSQFKMVLHNSLTLQFYLLTQDSPPAYHLRCSITRPPVREEGMGVPQSWLGKGTPILEWCTPPARLGTGLWTGLGVHPSPGRTWDRASNRTRGYSLAGPGTGLGGTLEGPGNRG